MNFSKLRKKLSKLDNLLKSLEDGGESPNKIEKELIKNYILDIYETATSDDNSPAPSSTQENSNGKNKIAVQQAVPVQTPVEMPKVEAKRQEAPEPVYTPAEIVVPQPKKEPEAQFSFVEEPETKVVTETKTHHIDTKENDNSHHLAAKSVQTHTTTNGNTSGKEELFLMEVGGEVSDKLGNLPIKTLKGAVGINDKILLVNQLFKGDMGKYNDMIDTIDKMDTFTQAKNFIQSEIVDRYNWADEDKANAAKGFIRLINRRFLN